MIAIEWSSRQLRATRWDALAGTGLLAWVVAALFPSLPALQRLWPTCHFRAWTGLPCGTCGFTRAFVRGARFDVAGALDASPLGTAMFFGWIAFSVWIALSWVVPAVPLPRVRVHPWVERFGPLAVFLANWLWLLWRASAKGAVAS